MPIFMHKKIYLGGIAFAVPPKYIIEPLFLILFQDYLFHCHDTYRLGTINLYTGTRHPYQVTAVSPTVGILSTKGNRLPMQ